MEGQVDRVSSGGALANITQGERADSTGVLLFSEECRPSDAIDHLAGQVTL